MKIFIASGNQHKIKEIMDIFRSASAKMDLEFHSISELNIPEPDEPYATFMENAIHKAKYYSSFTMRPTLSEDSGLCIEALDNFPGVKTKDFLQESGSLENAFTRLEIMLADKNNYAASFICAAALYLPAENRLFTSEGIEQGKLSFPARGNKCFGYDPIFIPAGYDQTMAELGDEVKNLIGHRASAMRQIYAQLLELSTALDGSNNQAV